MTLTLDLEQDRRTLVLLGRVDRCDDVIDRSDFASVHRQNPVALCQARLIGFAAGANALHDNGIVQGCQRDPKLSIVLRTGLGVQIGGFLIFWYQFGDLDGQVLFLAVA